MTDEREMTKNRPLLEMCAEIRLSQGGFQRSVCDYLNLTIRPPPPLTKFHCNSHDTCSVLKFSCELSR